MQKRRERVRAWQQAKAKRLAEETGSLVSESGSLETRVATGDDAVVDGVLADANDSTKLHRQVWSLEDEEEDSESEVNPSEDSVDTLKESTTKETPIITSTDDRDPLDDFMSTLYSSGDVAIQSVLTNSTAPSQNNVPPNATVKPATALTSGTSAPTEDETEDNEFFDGVNQYASSNVITLDQILAPTPSKAKDFTWESDTNPGSPETEDEEREERERREFLEAIRKYKCFLLVFVVSLV